MSNQEMTENEKANLRRAYQQQIDYCNDQIRLLEKDTTELENKKERYKKLKITLKSALEVFRPSREKCNEAKDNLEVSYESPEVINRSNALATIGTRMDYNRSILNGCIAEVDKKIIEIDEKILLNSSKKSGMQRTISSYQYYLRLLY